MYGRENGRTTGSQLLAVKVPRGTPTEKPAKRLIQEGEVWSLVTHPNIAPYLGLCFDFDRPGLPCLVSLFYQHGDVMSYLKNHPRVNRLQLMAQIADALSYLHDASIIHGDIKPSNVLINDQLEASLADFGTAIILRKSGFTTRTTVGTWRFMAPELMEAEEVHMKVSKATDMYAVAMTYVEISTDRVPFVHIGNTTKVIKAATNGDRPKRDHCRQITDNLWKVLEACWAADPDQRPSAKQLSDFLGPIRPVSPGQVEAV